MQFLQATINHAQATNSPKQKSWLVVEVRRGSHGRSRLLDTAPRRIQWTRPLWPGQVRCGQLQALSPPPSSTRHKPSSSPPILPQNLARPPSRPSRTFHPGRRAPRHPRSPPPSARWPPRSGRIEGAGGGSRRAHSSPSPRPGEMGQAFRKLFDAFFGNKEMRVRYLLPPFPFPAPVGRCNGSLVAWSSMDRSVHKGGGGRVGRRVISHVS